jgi:hypothetical protein
MIGNLNAILLFIIFSLIVSYFSKNMIIILSITVLLTNLFSLNINHLEGFEQPTNKPNKNTTDSTVNKKHNDATESVLH